jgi:replicative DNA helicase
MMQQQDLAFERALLACFCQFGLEAYIDVDFVTTETFTDQTNQILFECVKATMIEGGKPDLSTILSKSVSMGFDSIIAKDDEIAYIRSLYNFPVHKSNIGLYASKLTKLKVIRDGCRTLQACKNKLESFTGNEDIGEIVSSIEGPVSSLTSEVYNTSSNKPVKLTEGLMEYVDYLIANPNVMMGISTGIEALDRAIGGGLRTGVTLISARYKVGKSTTGIQIGMNIADRDNIPVLLLDTEMDYNSQKNRFIANYCMIDVNRLTRGEISPEEYERAQKAAERFDAMKISHLNVSGCSFETILSMARQWIYKDVGFREDGKANKCLVVYDYLKMTSDEGLNDSMKEYQIMGFQMTALHNFCVKYDVPCLSFVQLSRSNDIAQSDRIAWLCTSHTKFEEKSPEEQADDVAAGVNPPYNRKLTPIVARYGPCLDPGDYINVRMRGQYSKIEIGPTRNELLRTNTEITVPDIATVGSDSGGSGSITDNLYDLEE